MTLGWMGVQQIADKLGVEERTIKTLINSGELRAVESQGLFYVTGEQLAEFIDRRKTMSGEARLLKSYSMDDPFGSLRVWFAPFDDVRAWLKEMGQ